MHTAALVSLDASIDSFCWPNFDSPSVFARIVDKNKGGHFQIHPTWDKFTARASYLPNTAVLQSKFMHEEGVVTITDFLPRPRPSVQKKPLYPCLVRRVEAVRGRVPLKLECYPAFNYARDEHTTNVAADPSALDTTQGHSKATFASKDLTMELRYISSPGDTSKAPAVSFEKDSASVAVLGLKGAGVTAKFELEETQTVTFIFWEPEKEKVPETKPLLATPNLNKAKEDPGETTTLPDKIDEKCGVYWKGWVSKSSYTGRWREFVMHQQLLTFEPKGSIVAAPTFSLPEDLEGNGRTWDYRYCWVRDASFTIYAFIRLGFTEEARQYMHFMHDRIQERDRGSDNPLQIMFTIHGSKELQEFELNHLEGYRGQRPVRIGNGACDHLQLDIYGELMDAIYLQQKFSEPVSYDLWVQIREIVDWVCENWTRPDLSIWEVRSAKVNFTYSKVMCWVALDRGIRLSEKRSLPCPRRNEWYRIRDEIYEEIMQKGFNKEKGFFAQSYEGQEILDASLLIMPLVFFIHASDPRFQSTMEAILRPPEKGGLTHNNLVFRYDFNKAEDGIGGTEGAFSMCSFWMVEALTRAGSVTPKYLSKAVEVFEDLIQYSNSLGLFSEEISMSGEALGNSPQAFTHVSAISAAFNLDRALSGRHATQ
ncbi:glycoside hydrolase family 15 protein [Atractiella rhizophila]|nr:glycoside hydrolase family 15 protein [Atractiella rhizophila]